MLEIEVLEEEIYDEETEEFRSPVAGTIQLEHSLVSVSKWESKWEQPFIGDKERTDEQTLDYIRCMVLGRIDESLFARLSSSNVNQITEYINSKQSATWFAEEKNRPRSREVITSEVMYYWMVALQIPFECQYWHLNRFLNLVKVVNEKNKPEGKKMSKGELARRNRELNAKRKASMGTNG